MTDSATANAQLLKASALGVGVGVGFKSDGRLGVRGPRRRALLAHHFGTKTEREIRALLDRGGVVGGESAGAMIQASWMDTSDDDDFTPDVRALITKYGRAGFSLLANAAVFPHFDARGPDAAVKFSTAHPEELAFGIDNETALIVKGDRAEVVGNRTVSIFGGKRGAVVNPIVLHSGDRYDLAARR